MNVSQNYGLTVRSNIAGGWPTRLIRQYAYSHQYFYPARNTGPLSNKNIISYLPIACQERHKDKYLLFGSFQNSLSKQGGILCLQKSR